MKDTLKKNQTPCRALQGLVQSTLSENMDTLRLDKKKGGENHYMKKLICPACNADLWKEGVCYVEDGCYNELYYRWNAKKKMWKLEREENGQGVSDAYYACGNCDAQLPTELQGYFTNNV